MAEQIVPDRFEPALKRDGARSLVEVTREQPESHRVHVHVPGARRDHDAHFRNGSYSSRFASGGSTSGICCDAPASVYSQHRTSYAPLVATVASTNRKAKLDRNEQPPRSRRSAPGFPAG